MTTEEKLVALLRLAVNNRLKAEGIEIPFPQRDVTLHYPPREET